MQACDLSEHVKVLEGHLMYAIKMINNATKKYFNVILDMRQKSNIT